MADDFGASLSDDSSDAEDSDVPENNDLDPTEPDGESLEISAVELCNLLEIKYNATGYDDAVFRDFLDVYVRTQHTVITPRILNDVFRQFVEQGKTALVRLLLAQFGKDIDIDHEESQARGGGTSLTTAARWGHHQILQLLLDNGAEVQARTLTGETALELVCSTGNTDCVDCLLKHITNSFQGSTEEQQTVLYYGMCMAAYNGHDRVLRRFVDSGVDVNLNIDEDFGTPLHRSIEGGFIKCTDLLLDAGADVEAVRQCHQQTPLMRAAEFGHVEVLRRLLDKGAKIDHMTDECSAALNVSCHYGHVTCVKYLLSRGANPSLRNPWGFTPLFMGADTPEIVALLVDNKAVICLDELCGGRGEAAIHLATVVGCYKTVGLLLDRGSDVDVKTLYGETCLWLAAWKGHVDVSRLLIQRNCSLDDPSNGCQVYAYDYMPVEIAMGLGHFSIMRMILMAGCSLVNRVYYHTEESPSRKTGPWSDLPWVRLRPEPLQMRTSRPEEFAWFRDFLCNPCSLKHLCRLRIRRLLGARLNDKRKTKYLEIPQELLNYLSFSDL